MREPPYPLPSRMEEHGRELHGKMLRIHQNALVSVGNLHEVELGKSARLPCPLRVFAALTRRPKRRA